MSLPSINLPTLSSASPTSTSATYTTPAITVPPSSNNPYIIRESNINGTVFIAVGAIVGAILLGFALYHLIVSITASRMAKRSLDDDKLLYEKYQNNNSTAYGGAGGGSVAPSVFGGVSNNEFLSKLPFLQSKQPFGGLGGGIYSPGFNGSQVGDTSTIYASENGNATSKHDLTKMFISPTAEVMQHKRVRSTQFGSSTTNLSLMGGSNPNLASPANRHLQVVPNLYVNQETNNSDYSLAHNPGAAPPPPRSGRKTIPSMYLEDLMDEM